MCYYTLQKSNRVLEYPFRPQQSYRPQCVNGQFSQVLFFKKEDLWSWPCLSIKILVFSFLIFSCLKGSFWDLVWLSSLTTGVRRDFEDFLRSELANLLVLVRFLVFGFMLFHTYTDCM